MPPSSKPADASAGRYRIAAVAQITGIPVPTLRMWERRYTVVSPARSSGNGRLYSRADVERLSLLKAAVEAGHAIGTVASLPDDELRSRLEGSRGAVATQGPCRVLACGRTLPRRLAAAWRNRADIQLAGSLPTPQVTESVPSADVVVVEAATLMPALLPQLRNLRNQCGARLSVVIYGFGSRAAIGRLAEEGHIAVSAPADPAHIARLCHLGLTPAQESAAALEQLLMRPLPPRRYDEVFLAALGDRPSQIRCECPNHLADLLTRLYAFEQYSLECENTGAADAALHALLYVATGHCRALLEQALERVIQHEGIPDFTSRA